MPTIEPHPEPYYSDDLVTLYHGDCRQIMDGLSGVTAVVTDPPYGIALNTNYGSRGRGRLAASNDYGEHIVGDTEPFDPTFLLGYPTVVLFGANHFADKLPPSPGWVVWDKLNGLTGKRDLGFCDQADCELVWTNKRTPARLISHRWMGLLKDSEREDARLHPTQKPVVVMARIIRHYTSDGDVVLDPFAGSGTTLRAAKDEGRRAIGIEIDERYCELAAKRLTQDTLFGGVA